MKFFIAFYTSKITYLVLRLFRRKASHLPGKLALKICPLYLEKISKPKNIICVSGTDGKTTTANLLMDMFKKANYKVMGNKAGSNTDKGVATALTNCLNILGKVKIDTVVLEVDEHWTRFVFPKIKPNYLIVTNIIRDSLKRNAHPEYVFNKINQCGVEGMKVILNADELCSSQLLKNHTRIYYSIDKLTTDLKASKNLINDFQTCPNCESKLTFDYVRYCHIGQAHCPNCDFKSNDSKYKATKIDFKNNYLILNDFKFPLVNDSLFNIYNELACISLFLEMGFQYNELQDILNKVKITETRFTEQIINKTKVIKMMAKGNNSLPVSLVFDYIAKKKGNKVIVMALDDYDEQKAMEYTGWIYDTDYEFLNKKDIVQFIVTGPRCFDHKLRLLLAGIDDKKIICMKDELEALNKLKKKGIDSIFILHDMSSYELSLKAEEKIINLLGGKK